MKLQNIISSNSNTADIMRTQGKNLLLTFLLFPHPLQTATSSPLNNRDGS